MTGPRDTLDELLHERLHALVTSELDRRVSADTAVAEATPQPERDHIRARHAYTMHGEVCSTLRDCGPGHDLRVLNLTPHDVVLVDENSAGQVTLPPSGPSARVVLAEDSPCGRVSIAGLQIPVVRTATTKEVLGLPDRRSRILLIVSRMVAEAAADRDDLVFPHDSVRDDRGRVTGCRRLASLHPKAPHPPFASQAILAHQTPTNADHTRSKQTALEGTP